MNFLEMRSSLQTKNIVYNYKTFFSKAAFITSPINIGARAGNLDTAKLLPIIFFLPLSTLFYLQKHSFLSTNITVNTILFTVTTENKI